MLSILFLLLLLLPNSTESFRWRKKKRNAIEEINNDLEYRARTLDEWRDFSRPALDVMAQHFHLETRGTRKELARRLYDHFNQLPATTELSGLASASTSDDSDAMKSEFSELREELYNATVIAMQLAHHLHHTGGGGGGENAGGAVGNTGRPAVGNAGGQDGSSGGRDESSGGRDGITDLVKEYNSSVEKSSKEQLEEERKEHEREKEQEKEEKEKLDEHKKEVEGQLEKQQQPHQQKQEQQQQQQQQMVILGLT